MDCRDVKVREQVLCSDGTRTDAQLLGCGLTSFASWRCILAALPELIALKDHERVIGVVLGKDGLAVRLDHVTTPSA